MPTQRTFEQVADAIHRSNATAAMAVSRAVSIDVQESNLTLASNIAETFAQANPRFKRDVFMQACGYARKVEDC